ncbi:hypothetical protein [Noviherbaspirillum aerium]|uniref:hypothetical protein n=1 Tax=Noviherbaspirillum aerium TaxID=2588497 RepID=UPI00124C404B|nr:hypothetical protein [Noviherbaspirillum aerium]
MKNHLRQKFNMIIFNTDTMEQKCLKECRCIGQTGWLRTHRQWSTGKIIKLTVMKNNEARNIPWAVFGTRCERFSIPESRQGATTQYRGKMCLHRQYSQIENSSTTVVFEV